MKARFKRSVVERELGRDLRVGDIVEYPFKGRRWRIVALDGEHATLED